MRARDANFTAFLVVPLILHTTGLFFLLLAARERNWSRQMGWYPAVFLVHALFLALSVRMLVAHVQDMARPVEDRMYGGLRESTIDRRRYADRLSEVSHRALEPAALHRLAEVMTLPGRAALPVPTIDLRELHAGAALEELLDRYEVPARRT